MTDTHGTAGRGWNVKHAMLLFGGCLMAGIAGGYALRGLQGSPAVAPQVVAAPAAVVNGSASPSGAPSAASLKQLADENVAPLVDQLKANPRNPDLLVKIGNTYYDARQYAAAVDYYERALKVRPSDAAVRTDLGTAYWYMGNADEALAEFNKALSYAPSNPNTLFNRGLVKWKGKKDAAGALADWKSLLAVDPNYEAKDQVEKMIVEATRGQAPASGAAK